MGYVCNLCSVVCVTHKHALRQTTVEHKLQFGTPMHAFSQLLKLQMQVQVQGTHRRAPMAHPSNGVLILSNACQGGGWGREQGWRRRRLSALALNLTCVCAGAGGTLFRNCIPVWTTTVQVANGGHWAASHQNLRK